MGTPSYMSPEQCLGSGVDERTDIYALGIMLYEMLSGKPPFEGNFFAVLRMHMSKPIPPIIKAVPDLHPAVEAFVNELLSKEKDKRPRSAEEVIEKIDILEKSLSGGAQPAIAQVTTSNTKSSSASSASVTAKQIQQPKPVEPEQNIKAPTISAPGTAESAKNNTIIYVAAAAVVVIVLIVVWIFK
jgi:eukaryotic-like serine/threonine-protein kinase